MDPRIENPFKPGAGHMPPFLAGRDDETHEFLRLLEQATITENAILTGLRGLGKTVLLETFKPLAIGEGWFWAGTDLSESTSLSEENLATRLLTDLSVVTSSIVVGQSESTAIGFDPKTTSVPISLNYQTLRTIYDHTPGLVIDKLKAVFDGVWPHLKNLNKKGIIFAYDEAQNLSDHSPKDQYPTSLLLDLFQSTQRKNIPFMLVLTGLPTLFPKLVEARTYSERMFRIIMLDALNRNETIEAIRVPIGASDCPVTLEEHSYELLWNTTRGYPYFIQFVCRECFDVWIQSANKDAALAPIPMDSIVRKLDTDFFAGRWARATDRQRELLGIVSQLPNCDAEFSVQDIVESEQNSRLEKSFSRSHANQILAGLITAGLVYKNRHGRYSLAVPLLSGFIRRTNELSGSD